MAFKFNAILKFNGSGVKRQLNKASRGFSQMTNSVKKASQGIKQMGQGLRGLTLAGAPLTAGIVIATKEFADFEKQMSIVKSLTDPTAKEFAALQAVAKRMGATTSFSAKEAGQGLQFLALAGFSAEEQIGSLSSVLNLAAAGSLDLGLASDIVTDAMGALAPALDKSKTKVQNLTDLVDKMAFIQSKTNTSVTQLGEAIRLGGGAMAAAKIPLNSILVAMGGLANAGLKGTRAGTNLTAAFIKMAKPTDKAKEIMNELGISFRKANGDFKDMPTLIGDIQKGLSKIPGGADKAGKAVELFGRQGQRAIFALMNEGTENLTKLEIGLRSATGTASKQAKTRLDNLAGSFTLMSSAIKGVLIETGSLFGKFLTRPLLSAAGAIGNIAVGFQLVKGEITGASEGGVEFFKQFGVKKGKVILNFIRGFIEGFKEVAGFLTKIGKKVTDFFSNFVESSGDSAQSMGKLISKFIFIGAIAAPIFAGILAAMFVLGPIIAGIGGVVTVVTSAFGFLGGILTVVGAKLGLLFSAISLPVAGLIALAFFTFKAIGGFQGIKEAIVSFGKGFMEAFGPILGIIKDELSPTIDTLVFIFKDLFGGLDDGTTKATNDLTSFGKIIGEVMAFIALAITPVIKFVAQLVGGFAALAGGSLKTAVGIIQKIGGFFGFGEGKKRVEPKLTLLPSPAKEKVVDELTSPIESLAGAKPKLTLIKTEPELLGETKEIVKESKKIGKESVSQKGLVQPPSAKQTAKEIAVQNAAVPSGGTQQGSGGGTTKIILEMRGDAKKILNQLVTSDQIENSFLQGKDVENRFQKTSNGG